jgi:zinc/manganese transport system substrate-binding protein
VPADLRPGRLARLGGLGCALLVLAACSTRSAAAPRPGDRLAVVAAEDVWGSLAATLGGDRVDVHSLLTNPAADPHDHESTPADARAIADAGLVVVNGLGYDDWARDLVAVGAPPGRRVLDVGSLLGRRRGENPHRWYAPADVRRVVDRITADYQALRPDDAAYFGEQHDRLVAGGLAGYDAAVATIRARWAGTPVAATESLAAPLAEALDLRLVTPPALLEAVSEGDEPTTADKATADRQLASGAVAVLLLNAQNANPDAQRLVDAARSGRVPVVALTETISPRGAGFVAWQTRQLRDLAAALDHGGPG